MSIFIAAQSQGLNASGYLISLKKLKHLSFKTVTYNRMFEFFIRKKLISLNQSGFKPGESCINQLSAIRHEVRKSFDTCLDVRSVFLDISETFVDKVWYWGLLYKLKQNGMSCNLLEIYLTL